MATTTSSAVGPAEPHAPPYQYVQNQGYSGVGDIPTSLINRPDGRALPDDGDDEDLDDIFEDDDLDNEEWDPASADLTKSYNRQRQLHEADGGAALPKSNAQKPKANTFASIDDQISALSRHATKIRLDNVKQDQVREKDKADRATSELVLDQRTRMILLKMIDRGIVSEVHGAISTGKEANVYGSVFYPEGDGTPIQRAIKIYKTSILVFKDRERYIAGEHRFQKGADKGNNRKMVKLWAEKEFRNLKRIYAAGIPCPEPIYLKLHVLAMGFLGDRRGYAYPRLRDAVIDGDDSEQQWKSLYVQLLGLMRRMYQVCRLVHADLSEYNILYNKKTLYIIDVSQSVEPDHPRSLEFLRMDIKNVGDFFRRQGVDTLSDRSIFNFITTPDGPTEEPELSQVVEHLYSIRPPVAENDEAAAETEIDNEVFRNQYIPQTLQQVYDIEKDGFKIGQGEGGDLVYKNLLADQVVKDDEDGSDDQSEDETGSEASHSDDSGDESRFEKGTPRGRKFEDKNEKREHKQAVKEAKREKRKEKIPKHVKKKLVSASSRKKKA